MSNNSIFNIAVCIIGIVIFLIHLTTVLIKKNRRKDENALLNFLLLTIVHFSTYLVFTFIKINYTSNLLVMAFYTAFYIFNNLEAFFLFLYMFVYVDLRKKTKDILMAINVSLFAVFVILDILNIFTGFFFTAKDGNYIRADTMVISQIYQYVLFAGVILIALFNKNLKTREKVAFASYCLLPGVAIILQNFLKGYAVAYLSIIFTTEILFFFLNVQKNFQLAEEKEKNKEAQIKIMMSQIQPHFIYNSLSSISTLIPLDPNKAQEALDNFTEYLRHNISSLTQTELIPFEDELRHIETYVSLEEIRFGDRIKVIYDIKVSDFYVPPLCIQPIVENSIKHGILKKIEGGCVIIGTYETKDAYIVEVRDDGVGFNKDEIGFKENKHFGLNNIEYRINTMCHGKIEVESEVNKGTRTIITFYK